MRKVVINQYGTRNDGKWGVIGVMDAFFHGFGVETLPMEYGTGQFSTAIVEYADGVLESRPLRDVKFTPPYGGNHR